MKGSSIQVQDLTFKVRDSQAGIVPESISEVVPDLSSPKSRRLGLFGGTFNPIHLGHLRAGIEIQETFALDQVLFIPTAVPPHKKPDHLLPFFHRLKMVRLALTGHPCFRASAVEKQREGKSYSIETVRLFKKRVKSKAELFFILGIDAFLEINTWKDYRELFTLTHFVVMDRPGYRRTYLKQFLRKEVSSNLIFYPKENRYLFPSGFSVYLTSITLMDISSTRIRALRRNNQSVCFLLPESVEDYILKKDLYVS